MLFFAKPLVAQITELECTIQSRSGEYLILKPAHYTQDVLPAEGEKAVLFLYVKDGLEHHQKEGYYELFEITLIKQIPANGTIKVQCMGNIEDNRKRYGMDALNLNTSDKVKLSWTAGD